MAARIARAATGKDKIIISGYHGWSDWYLAANLNSRDSLNNHLRPHLEPLGVPKGLKNTVFPFDFNDIKGYISVNWFSQQDLGMATELDDFKDKCETGTICPQSGRWMCSLHPAVTKSVRKGDVFPACSQGAGHITTWWYMVPPYGHDFIP